MSVAREQEAVVPAHSVLASFHREVQPRGPSMGVEKVPVGGLLVRSVAAREGMLVRSESAREGMMVRSVSACEGMMVRSVAAREGMLVHSESAWEGMLVA